MIVCSCNVIREDEIRLAARKGSRTPEDAYATLVSLYVQRQPGQVLPVLDASHIMTPEEIKAENEFTNHLLGKRNTIMVERMKPLLDAGGAFVAVGALHLIGQQGLIELLRREGYTVTRIQ